MVLLGLSLNLVNCNSHDINYSVSSEELLKFYADSMKVNSESIISKTEFQNMLNSDRKDIKYLDVRSSHKYIEFHLANSINHPFTNSFASEKNINELRSIKSDLHIIGEDSKQAMVSFLLLKQLGFENIKVVLGGVDYAFKVKSNHFDVLLLAYNDEIAKYDYQKIMSESSSKPTSKEKDSVAKRKKVVKREKKAVSGGCG